MKNTSDIQGLPDGNNFLQRAVDRLEESGSSSKVRLFGYMVYEALRGVTGRAKDE